MDSSDAIFELETFACSLVPRRSLPFTGERKVAARAWEPVCVAAGHSVTSLNFGPNRVSGRERLGTRLICMEFGRLLSGNKRNQAWET